MPPKSDPRTTLFDEQVEPSVLQPPSTHASRPTAHRALAVALANSIFTPAEKKRLKAKKPLSIIVLCPDESAHKHLARIISTMGNPSTFAVIKDEKGDLKSPELRHATPSEALGAGSGVISLVRTLEEVPPPLVVASERTHIIGGVEIRIVAEVIRACTSGHIPKTLGSMNLSTLSFSAICAAIGRGGKARDSVARLAKAAAKAPIVVDPAIPNLEEAIEFGAARDWGLDLKADVADFITGKIAWNSVDRGVVLHGVPGTGKSLFAKALAQACGIPLIVGSMGEFFASTKGHLGDVIKRQKELFEEAKACRPSILFIDEINALPDIDKLSRNDDWWRPVILDFYLRLDSLTADRDGVVVIGATNRLEDINPALLRPGRLERAIEIGLPNAAGVERILRHHLKGELNDVNLEGVSLLALGSTPAQLMEQTRSAMRQARRSGRGIQEGDLRRAILGDVFVHPDFTRRVALHEAGHAIAAWRSPSFELVDVSIVSAGGLSGRVEILRRSSALTLETFEEETIYFLAGRAAEIVSLGDASAGAGGSEASDLARATSLVAAMIVSLGLGSDKSALWRCPPDQAISLVQRDGYLRSQVEERLEILQARAELLVRDQLEAIEQLAERLIERHRMTGEEVYSFLNQLRRIA